MSASIDQLPLLSLVKGLIAARAVQAVAAGVHGIVAQ